MKRVKTTLVLGVLIAGMGYSNVYSMRACLKKCRSNNKKLEHDNKKPDLNVILRDGFTPLNRALSENDFSRAQRLLLQGADPSITSGELRWTALHWAVFKGYDVFVEAIMRTHRHLMYVQDAEGKTPVMLVHERITYIKDMHDKISIDDATFSDDKKGTGRMLQLFL